MVELNESPASAVAYAVVSVQKITATLDDALNVDFTGSIDNGPPLPVFTSYRATDPFGPWVSVLTAWIADNPTFPITPYVPPTTEEKRQAMIPLTARQFRLGLVNAGISPSQVTATITAMPAGPDKEKAQIEWEYATTFNRMHPLIATVGAALGLNDTQIDAMWLLASGL